MIDWMMTSYFKNCQVWSDTVTDLTRQQWKFLTAQSHFGISLWNALLSLPLAAPARSQEGESAKPAEPSETVREAGGREPVAEADLEKMATERLRRGLAPPREIYDVQNRGRIDWSMVPDWARPVDPEVFEGGHEG